MTIGEVKKYFPQDLLTALSDDLEVGLPNDELLNMYIQDAEKFIDSITTISDPELKDIHIAEYVIFRLYERLGYQEQAKAYYERLVDSLRRTTGVEDKTESKISVSSNKREFTAEELEKW